MTLGELLSELRDNILYDRSDLVTGSSDALWSDATLVRYIDEAQKRFARKALVIRDGQTPACTQVTLSANMNEYPLHASVLAVISVRLVGDRTDLARAGHAQFDTYRTPDTYFFDPAQLVLMPPGKPLAFATDDMVSTDAHGSMGRVVLRIFPVPSEAFMTSDRTLQLRVIRMPLNPLSATNLDAVPEIPEEHHIEMLDWAAYLALRIVDRDATDIQRANEFRASFEAHVEAARKAFMRKVFAPMTWGFGRNGFAWEGN